MRNYVVCLRIHNDPPAICDRLSDSLREAKFVNHWYTQATGERDLLPAK